MTKKTKEAPSKVVRFTRKRISFFSKTFTQMLQSAYQSPCFTRTVRNYLKVHQDIPVQELVKGAFLLADLEKLEGLKILLSQRPIIGMKTVDQRTGKKLIDHICENTKIRDCRKQYFRELDAQNGSTQTQDSNQKNKEQLSIFDIIASDQDKASEALGLFLKVYPNAYDELNDEGMSPCAFAASLNKPQMLGVLTDFRKTDFPNHFLQDDLELQPMDVSKIKFSFG